MQYCKKKSPAIHLFCMFYLFSWLRLSCNLLEWAQVLVLQIFLKVFLKLFLISILGNQHSSKITLTTKKGKSRKQGKRNFNKTLDHTKTVLYVQLIIPTITIRILFVCFFHLFSAQDFDLEQCLILILIVSLSRVKVKDAVVTLFQLKFGSATFQT